MSGDSGLEVPEDVRAALTARGLRGAFDSRPRYQQEGYVWLIEEAGNPGERTSRIARMLEELGGGRLYLGMRFEAPGGS